MAGLRLDLADVVHVGAVLQEEGSWKCCILWASNFVVGVVLGECSRIDETAWRCKMSSKRAVVEEISW